MATVSHARSARADRPQRAQQRQRPAPRDTLARDDKVLVHCAAGMGRTGMPVVRPLVDSGLAAGKAIARVRAARRGTMETEAQAAFAVQKRLFTLHDRRQRRGRFHVDVQAST
jgi:hypothetical protein